MFERILRAWFGLRERVGHPKRFTEPQFAAAGTTTLLAGSPWVCSVSSSRVAYVTTSTTWSNQPTKPE